MQHVRPPAILATPDMKKNQAVRSAVSKSVIPVVKHVPPTDLVPVAIQAKSCIKDVVILVLPMRLAADKVSAATQDTIILIRTCPLIAPLALSAVYVMKKGLFGVKTDISTLITAYANPAKQAAKNVFPVLVIPALTGIF